MHDFMKTIISAIKLWVEDKIKISVKNWNQTNPPNWNAAEGESDYIAKKTHYAIKLADEKTIVNQLIVPVAFDKGYYWSYQEETIPSLTIPKEEMILGPTYTMIWENLDGGRFECVGTATQDGNTITISWESDRDSTKCYCYYDLDTNLLSFECRYMPQDGVGYDHSELVFTLIRDIY